jgi:cytoskeletal protein CcmA (bactofilin family)
MELNVFSISKRERDKKSLNKTAGEVGLKKAAEPGRLSPKKVSTLGRDMIITGNIVCDGSVYIFGRVIGDIQAPHLVIGEGAQVEGDVIAPEMTIHGAFKGAIHGNNVKLQRMAVVDGEVHNKPPTIEQNAQFEGVSRRLQAKKKLSYFAIVLFCGSVISAAHISKLSSDNTYDRIQAGRWVVASMYWEDKLVSTGRKFDPIGLHAAHKTLPIGTLIRVSNPKNYRSINVTINDRGPYVPDRELDLTLGAGALLGFQGLGILYMEVLPIPPTKNIQRPAVETLFQ